MYEDSGAIAVVAIHGVGPHEPGEMAREVAGLLQRANPGKFERFFESQIELEVSKLAGLDAAAPEAMDDRDESDAPWYVRTPYARMRAASEVGKRGRAGVQAAGDVSEDIGFTRKAVLGAQIDPQLARYQSLELSATRSQGDARTRIDVFEMHWADLSRLGTWIGRVVGEFYQILFHVILLGQKTVELAWCASRGKGHAALERLLRAQTLMGWTLSSVLPVLNVAMLFSIIPVATMLTRHTGVRAALIGGVLAVALIAGACWWIARSAGDASSNERRAAARAWQVFAAAIAAGIVGAALAWQIYEFGAGVCQNLLFVTLTAVAGAGYVAIVRSLVRRRDRLDATVQKYAGIVAGLIWFGLVVLAMVRHSDAAEGSEVQMAMLIAEGLFLAFAAAWVAFIVFGWLTCLFGFLAALRSPRPVRAAIWTGKMSMFLPATLFFLVTVLFWHLLAETLLKPIIPKGLFYQSVLPDNAVTRELSCAGIGTIKECMDHLIAQSAGAGFNAFALSALAAVVLLVIGLLPSALHDAAPPMTSTGRASRILGSWLDVGMVLSRIAGYVVLVGLLGLLPVFQLIDFLGEDKLLESLGLSGPQLLNLIGGTVLGSAGLLVLFREVLQQGLSKALGIVFDVDNWLRERPLESNPRGRILLRYLALLRHICARGYRRLVIVSHSQGTVITADLLRYLKLDPGLGGTQAQLPPVTLLTFGSPLRQLYGLRFPGLYGWARAEEGVSAERPDYRELCGVERWINGYRSGDYVGRFFWTAKDQWLPNEQPKAGAGPAYEFCLGAGGHTHYFDGTAAAVGRLLDSQLSLAAAAGPDPGWRGARRPDPPDVRISPL